MSRVRLAENLYVQLSISPPLPPCGSPISSSKRTTTPAGFFPSLSLSLSLSLRSPLAALEAPKGPPSASCPPLPSVPAARSSPPSTRLESALGALLFFPRSKICDCFLIPVLHPSDRLSGSKSGGGLASSRGLLCGIWRLSPPSGGGGGGLGRHGPAWRGLCSPPWPPSHSGLLTLLRRRS